MVSRKPTGTGSAQHSEAENYAYEIEEHGQEFLELMVKTEVRSDVQLREQH